MEYPCIHLRSLTRFPILQNSTHVLNRLSVSHIQRLAQSPIKFRQEVIAVMQIIVKSDASNLRRKQFLFTWHIAHLQQECHNTTVSQHNSATTQQCQNSKFVIFSGETFKDFEVL